MYLLLKQKEYCTLSYDNKTLFIYLKPINTNLMVNIKLKKSRNNL